MIYFRKCMLVIFMWEVSIVLYCIVYVINADIRLIAYYYNYASPKSPMSTDKGTVHNISKL